MRIHDLHAIFFPAAKRRTNLIGSKVQVYGDVIKSVFGEVKKDVFNDRTFPDSKKGFWSFPRQFPETCAHSRAQNHCFHGRAFKSF